MPTPTTYTPSLHKQIRRRDSRASTQWRRDLKRAFNPEILFKRADGGKWPRSIESLPRRAKGELGAAIMLDSMARAARVVERGPADLGPKLHAELVAACELTAPSV